MRGQAAGSLGAGDLPEGQMPIATQGRERPGGRQGFEIPAIEGRTRGEILRRSRRLAWCAPR